MSKKIYTIQSSDKIKFDKKVNELLEFGGDLMDGGYQVNNTDHGIVYSQVIVFKNNCELEVYENGEIKSIKNESKKTGWFESGIKEREYFLKENKVHGLSTLWFESGNKYSETMYEDDKRNGLRTTWYENGQKLIEGYFINGKAEGLQTRWYENGNKMQEKNLKAGKEDGKQTDWYENGHKKREVSTQDGVLAMKITNWYDNGQMRASYSCKDGLPDGVASGWEKSGKEFHAGSFVDGNGFLITLQENSNNKRTEVHFKDGIQVSLTYWYENGNKDMEAIYVDGEPKTIYWAKDGEYLYELDGISRTLCTNFY